MTQASPAGRYVMLSGLVPITVGGLGVLVQRLRTRQQRCEQSGRRAYASPRAPAPPAIGVPSPAQGEPAMVTPGSDSPATPSRPKGWGSAAVMLGLVCVIGGLFLAAGFKEAFWPKVMGAGGVFILVVGFVANAIMSRHRPSSGD